jgi:hypothetical protein
MTNKGFLLFTIFILISFWGCSQQLPTNKINGISLVASPDSLTLKDLKPLQELQANYIAIMPFGFIKNTEHPEIIFNTNRQWFGETSKGAKQYIALLHQNGFEVMVKPHIWIWNGEYTGLLKMTSEAHWKELEDAYRDFILTYAKMAEEMQCNLFCIGTELELFVANRPEYWERLIAEIRTVFSGKLTYASNWDEYSRVPFWKKLDYIGIDAYFPITESQNPTLKELKQGWLPWKEKLKITATTFNKPILFTEYGYRSMDYAAKEPWTVDHTIKSNNLEAQKNALQALYESLWSEPWMAGGFLWKWHKNHPEIGGLENNRFTPQNKPAQNIIKQYYKKAN